MRIAQLNCGTNPRVLQFFLLHLAVNIEQTNEVGLDSQRTGVKDIKGYKKKKEIGRTDHLGDIIHEMGT
jgi:hypothetical protein